MPIFTKASGTWYTTDLRTKTGGVWYNTDPYVKSAGVWKKLYPDIGIARTAAQTGNASSGSWGGQSIGTGGSNRVLVFMLTVKNTVATPTITVDGVAATPIAIGNYTVSTPDILAVLYQINRPDAATTATIAFSMGGTGPFYWACYAIYSENRVVADTFAGGFAPGVTAQGGITMLYPGGITLVVSCCHVDNNAFTPINCVEVADVSVGGDYRHFEGYSQISGTPTVGADTGISVHALAMASWNRL